MVLLPVPALADQVVVVQIVRVVQVAQWRQVVQVGRGGGNAWCLYFLVLLRMELGALTVLVGPVAAAPVAVGHGES